MLSLLNIDYSSMISTLPLDSGSSDSLSNFINNGLIGLVTEADTTYKIAGSVIALILALIGCFFGYKLSRLFMGITGFIAGAIIGQIVASQILHVEGFASVLCIILCGAVIASLAFWIYRIGIFILCFALAFSAAGTLSLEFSLSNICVQSLYLLPQSYVELPLPGYFRELRNIWELRHFLH